MKRLVGGSAVLALNIVTILCAAAVGISVTDIMLRRNDLHRHCLAMQHLERYAYQSALRAEKTLPTLAYYKQHPDELRNALAQTRDQARFFTPEKC